MNLLLTYFLLSDILFFWTNEEKYEKNVEIKDYIALIKRYASLTF